jgi:carbamoyl-phosphate synthase small subunit
MIRRKQAILLLEDGTLFEGESFGREGETFGEVVFNTSMTGYQEILTDPSYAGQIVTMTYPHIGNYGVNSIDVESRHPFVEGFIVREGSNFFSNWRAEKSLEDYLKNYKIVGIQGIDTRALTKHIRLQGAMKGAISTEDLDPLSLGKRLEKHPSIIGRDLVKDVTINKPYLWDNKEEDQFRVVLFDFGLKLNIARELAGSGCAVYVVPATTTYEEVLEFEPDGVCLSNGPGDPAAVPYAVETVRNLLGKISLFGICLGHQLLGLALDGRTFKLKFGHHGSNHPVKNLKTGEVEITSQNHGFAVDPDSVPGRVEITHTNLNDQTVEGLRCLDIPAFSVQYHPEASPGPHDSKYLFQDFLKLMEKSNAKWRKHATPKRH